MNDETQMSNNGKKTKTEKPMTKYMNRGDAAIFITLACPGSATLES